MVLSRTSGQVEHRCFPDLVRYLQPGDLFVLNDSRVFPARLLGRKTPSRGQIEVLLLEEKSVNDWWVLLRPGKRVRPGTRIHFQDALGQETEIQAEVIEKNSSGQCRLLFCGMANVAKILDNLGRVPLPPYIRRIPQTCGVNDRERYQTVFAKPVGSVAAPTAGLHFTKNLLSRIRRLGVKIRSVTLHVGLGTFAPIKTETAQEHLMHEERFRISAETARAVKAAKRAGGRVIAVGTTSVRALETAAAAHGGEVAAMEGRTRLFIYPPFPFRVVDGLLTNFHLPESTLLMLVSAFAAPNSTRGREIILAAYAEAIRARYRFFSYGDAMLIL